ncbi:MAG: Sec-independent protein translocase protein TatB [Pseudomonadota bacterium]
MFDIGALELLMIVIVAVLVIGPKDMPAAMRTAGRWIGQVRKVSAHFRTGVDAMVREAELEDMEKKWKARNEEIMKQHPLEPATPPSATAESAVREGTSAEEAASTMTGPPSSDDAAVEAPIEPKVDTPTVNPGSADKV